MSKPNTTIQRFNALIHREPWSYVSHCVFWSLFWVIAAPIALWALTVQLVVSMFQYCAPSKYGKILDPNVNTTVELAVVVTGCDGGFGKDLAWEAADDGFIVFAGCLNEASLKQFRSEPRIIAMKMDVTSEIDVQAAVERVDAWLRQNDEGDDKQAPKKTKRHLHALVNNAGMAVTGLIDWLDMSSIDKQMQVNYFGMVRTCKAFLPIFKDQAPLDSPRHYARARIINMISGAGLNALGTPTLMGYEASKNAAESFTASLRWEMKKLWNVQVTAINPSFHETPMSANAESDLTNTWNKLSPELRNEYGKDYFDHLKKYILEKVVFCVWPAPIVTEEFLKCLHALHPPAQLLVGMDARFALTILRLIPAWARTMFISLQDQNSVKPTKMNG